MFMKKKIMLLLITTSLLTGCGYDKYEMPKDAYINLNKNSYLVFEDIKINNNTLVTNEYEVNNGNLLKSTMAIIQVLVIHMMN